MTFSERIKRTARAAGYQAVYFLPPARDREIPPGWEDRLFNAPADSAFLILKGGCLPDVSFLQSLKRPGVGPGRLEKDGLPWALAFRRDEPQGWVEELILGKDDPHLFRRMEKAFPTLILTRAEGTLYRIDSPELIPTVENALFRNLIKDTEGFMSKHVERKISLALSKRLANTSVTPNQMTLLSLFVGLLGAAFLGTGEWGFQIAGALLFLLHSILDGCDGELARIKFMPSRWGGIMDYWGDNIVHSAVFFALALAWSQRVQASWPLLLGGCAILGTIASAGWIFQRTMRDKEENEPLYTSVSSQKEKSRIVKLADFASRRDFIYLVVLLALFRKLDFFLLLSALGAPLFFFLLIWIYVRESMG